MQSIECYAATRPQAGRTHNEDAFLIGRGNFVALADGAGNAERTAKRLLTFFEKLLVETEPARIAAVETWTQWVKTLDSFLLGGAQSTFLALAFIGTEAFGVCVGDSRAYLVDHDRQCRILTDGAAKYRLGSGHAQALPLRLNLNRGDQLLLLSDGAWTPLSLYVLQKVVATASLRHFSDVPSAILDAAGKAGRADDMTAIAVRLAR